MSECKCTFAKKLTGDGCEVCNPAKALEYAKEEIELLTAERDALKKDAERYRYIRCGCSHDDMYRLVDLHCEQFDAVIDKAMEQSK